MTTLVADLDGSATLRAELAKDARFSDPDTPPPYLIARWQNAAADLHQHAADAAKE